MYKPKGFTTFGSLEGGFTLVELIVVASVTVVLGFLLTDILLQTLRGENKVKVITQVKQNGQAVLDKLSAQIRSADKIICVGKISPQLPTNIDDTIVVLKDGIYTRITFHPQNGLDNGYIDQMDFDESDINTFGNLCIETLSVNLTDLARTDVTNRDPKTGVSLATITSKPIFKRLSSQGYNDAIEVNFAVKSAPGAGEAAERSTTEEGIPFSTAVLVRNIK